VAALVREGSGMPKLGVAVVVSLGLVAPLAQVSLAQPARSPDLPLVVSAAWLAEHIKDPDLVLLHVGDPGAFRKQHIAGARSVTLADISLPHHGEGIMLELPPADDLRRRLEALGISDRSRVIVYFGQDWVSPATRVVLTLDAAGLGGHTALLDGGMQAWVRAGQPVGDAAPPATRGTLSPLALRPVIVDATTVVASLGKPGFAVVDARDAKFYDGVDVGDSHGHAHKRGHIAGALSIPFDSVFDDQNLLRAPDDLKARFAKAGVKPGDTVIGYCHIGQQATAMLFAARRLGHPVKLYDGSFEDWSLQHPAYPVATTAAKPAEKR
jgi:thiosulfate/3-mercaptopyruvate sulfurtransferase